MEQIKDAFQKIKQDISFLYNELSIMKNEVFETRQVLVELSNLILSLNNKVEGIFKEKEEIQKQVENLNLLDNQKDQKTIQQTTQQITSTSPTHTSTDNTGFNPGKAQNIDISTGNDGVPTDRQTDRQTDRHTPEQKIIPGNSIENAAEILDSLDNIKKEIRLKFKRLTTQEMLVFTTLYQFDQEKGFTDYKELANSLKLTESSIRDYIGRLVKKGIPIDKIKLNNKTIQLNVSKGLKKIASLNTILQLRDM